MIDPMELLDAPAGAMETKFTPPDIGEYIAMVPQGGVEFQPYTQKSTGQPAWRLVVQWEISKDDPRYKEQSKKTGQVNLRVRQTLFNIEFDMSPDGKPKGIKTGPGCNIGLGRLRDALGQNDPAKKWNPRHLEGSVGRIDVEHTLSDGDTYAQVKRDGVTKL